jgi:hypothetical protein
VLAGLAVLEQAADLAEGIALESFAKTTRSAIVAYRAHFGAGERSPIEELAAHLQILGEDDRYSRRLVLTELAKAHAFRGDHESAARELRRAEDVALPDGDRRATVKLYVTHALLEGLAHGEPAARVWLARASPLVDPATDRALVVEMAWVEYVVCPAMFRERSAEALRAVAESTGIARAAYLAAARGAPTATLASEDRFADLVRTVREGQSSLDRVLSNGLLGLLPLCSGRAPAARLWIDAARGLFAVEDHGTVVRREVPSDALLLLLRTLARGPHDKEALIGKLWRLKVYRPEQHDAVVHTAISRLRTALEPHGSWIQMSDGAYRFAAGVELVDAQDPQPSQDPQPAQDANGDLPTLPRPKEADARRATALALVRRAGGAATRDVAEALKISEMTAFRLLTHLAEEGLITRTGRGRNTRYNASR